MVLLDKEMVDKVDKEDRVGKAGNVGVGKLLAVAVDRQALVVVDK